MSAPATASIAWRRRGLGIDAAGLLAIAFVGWLDRLTGTDYTLSLLYLLPVASLGWWRGAASAIVAAGAAALAVYLADATAFGPSLMSAAAWNASSRFVIFLFAGLLTSRVRRDREDLKALNARLARLLDHEATLARTDSLTGLANTRAFLERLHAEGARARRQGSALCLAYLDLDEFKGVNDTYGHPAGDALLTQVAQVLVQQLRAEDVAARLGGDEFAILLAGLSREAAQGVGERLIAAVAELARDFPAAPFGLSVGMTFSARPPEDPEAMVRAADAALYAAKAEGKGIVLLREG